MIWLLAGVVAVVLLAAWWVAVARTAAREDRANELERMRRARARQKAGIALYGERPRRG